MVDLSFGFRMSPKTFETEFFPTFKEFSFVQANKIVMDLLSKQNHEETATQIAKIYQNKKLADRKFVCSFTEFYQNSAWDIRIDFVLNDLIKISENPSAYKTQCCDSSMNVWIHQGRIYATICHANAADFSNLKNVDNFSVEPDFDRHGRMPTWQKVFAESGKMRLDIIKGSSKIGFKEIFQNLSQKKELAA